MKKYHILIKDALKGRFRVCQMAPTGEMINQSEALETVDSVLKNILASLRVAKCKEVKCAKQLKTENQRLIHIHKLCVFSPYLFIDYKGKNKQLNYSFNRSKQVIINHKYPQNGI